MIAVLLNDTNADFAATFGELAFFSSVTPQELLGETAAFCDVLRLKRRERRSVRLIANITVYEVGLSPQTSKDELLPAALPIIGSANDIADTLQQLLESRTIDGFNLVPSNLEAAKFFVTKVAPILLKREKIVSSGEPRTLRRAIDLPHPVFPSAALEAGR